MGKAASAQRKGKSLRETLKPLISLKTAKSVGFRAQRYQQLSRTRDFAGEAISFRFGFVFGSRENNPRPRDLEIQNSALRAS
jgi:hypothetical protein